MKINPRKAGKRAKRKVNIALRKQKVKSERDQRKLARKAKQEANKNKRTLKQQKKLAKEGEMIKIATKMNREGYTLEGGYDSTHGIGRSVAEGKRTFKDMQGPSNIGPSPKPMSQIVKERKNNFTPEQLLSIGEMSEKEYKRRVKLTTQFPKEMAESNGE
jgi:hypothetical protein